MSFLKKTFSKKNRIFQKIFLQQVENYELHELYNFNSDALKRNVRIDLFLPPTYFSHPHELFPVLYFNDGQDMEALQMKATLERLQKEQKIKACVIVAIHAGDRMQEYGTIRQPDYKQRGGKAASYAQFMLKELFPFLERRYRIATTAEDRTIAGFSLGGLSAFDLAWKNPSVFGRVGVFSGSFWWRSEDFDPKDPDANRIVYEYLKKGKYQKGMQFWLQVGTEDEKDDRNNNGIIDAIDDTLDVIKALEQIGYKKGRDIKYVEVQGGQHNPPTWGKIMPDFLQWAIGK